MGGVPGGGHPGPPDRGGRRYSRGTRRLSALAVIYILLIFLVLIYVTYACVMPEPLDDDPQCDCIYWTLYTMLRVAYATCVYA